MKNTNRLQTFAFVGLVAILLLFSATSFSQSLPAPKEEKLLNGLKVLMWNDVKSDKVSVKIRVHSGSAFDPQGKEGTMQLLADDLFPNDASRDFFKEDLGGSLEVVTTYDYIQINASSKPESLLTMLETLATAISNPTIDKDTTAKIRTALLARLKVLEADPAYVADQAVAKRLFGTFPYGRPQQGTTASVPKIDFADLTDAKQRFLSADNATMTISGSFDRDLTYRAIRRYFGGWLKSDKHVPSTFRQPDEPDKNLLTIEMSGLTKSYSRSASIAPGRTDKDYYATQAFYLIRKDERCPNIGTYQTNLLKGVYVHREEKDIPKDSKIIDSLPIYSGPCSLILQGADGALIVPYSQDQLDRAKAKIMSNVQSQISLPTGLADLWLDVDTYKLISPDDEIKKISNITLADIKRVAEKLVTSPSVSVVVTSPKAVK